MSDALPNIVIINNKPMTYDSRGDLVELEVSGESKNEQIYEKANFYKNSDFVTKSKFTHNGILTKHNFTTKKPPHNSKFTFDSDFPSYSVIHSLFHKGPEHFPTSLVFDDVAPVQSFINSTYDIFKYPQKFETTRQRPTIAFYTTPAPTSIIPIIVTQPTNNNKKSNKKTKTKKTPQTPVTSDIHEHIMKNLEYYKKLLNVNCTFKGPQNENRIEENETVEVTPRPTKIAVNDKDIHEKDKSKKKCDCKHHHGHHHQKHSHEKHSHENYKPAVVLHKPSAIQPVYVQSHKLPEIQTHFHHHQSSKGNSGIEVADNAALFDSTGKLPPLGVEYNEVGNIFDTIEGLLSTNNNNKDTDDVDYESRDESGSDYSESIEEEHEGVEESSESDYEDDDKRRRRKREIFGGKNHNYSRQHVEGRVGGKVELLNERLKRKIAPPQLSSNFSHDVITTRSRSIPSDFMEMISHMFSPSTKSDAPIKLLSSAIKKKYNNFQLWRIQTSKKSEISYLDELRMSSEGRKLHWLESPRLFSFTDVVVAPEHLESFKKFLAKGNINFNLKLRNVQNAIRFENFRLNRREQVEGEIMNGHPLTFYRYHPSKDIIAYYDFIKRKYPTFVELITIGFTFHSKPIFCIKVSAPKLQQQPKPGVFILAGVSSHLWLPVSSSLNILDNIVKNLANNDSLGEYIRKYDWFVLSLLNVDGYDYSMAFDRLWRKTRSEYTIDDSSGLMSMP